MRRTAGIPRIWAKQSGHRCSGARSDADGRVHDATGDPNRTSFELQLNSDMAIWLAGAPSADVKRTVGGRLADAQLLPQCLPENREPTWPHNVPPDCPFAASSLVGRWTRSMLIASGGRAAGIRCSRSRTALRDIAPRAGLLPDQQSQVRQAAGSMASERRRVTTRPDR